MARITTRITNLLINATAHAAYFVADKANLSSEQNLALTKRLHKLDKIVLKTLERDAARALRKARRARAAYDEAVNTAENYSHDVWNDDFGIQREEATQAKEKAIANTKAADAAFQAQIAANVRSFDVKHAALMAAHKAEAKARQHCKDCSGTFGNGEAA